MELSNVEFVLLQIIYDRREISGYEISQIIKERGYHEWTDIGTTSTYVGLNKLSKKQLVNSYIDTEKQGKGPVPRKFTITDEGKKILLKETIAALSATRERDLRFDLALAAISFISTEEAITALKTRKDYLVEVADTAKHKLESQREKKVPFNFFVAYYHSLILIKYEIEFMDGLLQKLLENDLPEVLSLDDR